MARKFVLALAVLSLFGFASQNADAVIISRQNPFRSYNISGINYGSMQWEKNHRSSNHSYQRGSGRVWRRR